MSKAPRAMLELFPIFTTMTPAQVTNLGVSSVTATTINGNYNTLGGNQPNTYGNAVFLWQNPNQIPYNQPPLNTYQIPGNTQSGSFAFPDLQVQIKSYIMGFAVGPNVSQICSTAYVPASGTTFEYFQSTLNVQDMGTDSVTINYSTPAGNQPQTNGNWVGLWQGEVASYTNPPAAKTNVGNNNAVGQATINNYPFLRGTTYTVAYFMGSRQTMMAATYTFST